MSVVEGQMPGWSQQLPELPDQEARDFVLRSILNMIDHHGYACRAEVERLYAGVAAHVADVILAAMIPDACGKCGQVCQPFKWWRSGTAFYRCGSCGHRWTCWCAAAVGHGGRPPVKV